MYYSKNWYKKFLRVELLVFAEILTSFIRTTEFIRNNQVFIIKLKFIFYKHCQK